LIPSTIAVVGIKPPSADGNGQPVARLAAFP